MNWKIAVPAFFGSIMGMLVMHFWYSYPTAWIRAYKFRKGTVWLIEDIMNPRKRAIIASLGILKNSIMYQTLMTDEDFKRDEEGYFHQYETGTQIKRIKKEDIPLYISQMKTTKHFDKFFKKGLMPR